MKKKFLLSFSAYMPAMMYAQSASSRTEINSMLQSWIIPIMGLIVFTAFAILVFVNLDALRGKNGLSKEEGWMNVGQGVIYVVLGISILGFVASKLAGMSFTI